MARKVNETLLGKPAQAPGPRQACAASSHRALRGPQGPGLQPPVGLPFSVATSYGEWEEDDRVAWVRALQVDRRLTVVAAAPDRPRARRQDRRDQGYKKNDANKMLAGFAELRDDGEPSPSGRLPADGDHRSPGAGVVMPAGAAGDARLPGFSLADEHSSAGDPPPDHPRRSPVDGAGPRGPSEEGGRG